MMKNEDLKKKKREIAKKSKEFESKLNSCRNDLDFYLTLVDVRSYVTKEVEEWWKLPSPTIRENKSYIVGLEAFVERINLLIKSYYPGAKELNDIRNREKNENNILPR